MSDEPNGSERRPLLGAVRTLKGSASARKTVAVIITLVFVIATAVGGGLYANSRRLPDDPLDAALVILERHPIFDTHIDLPELVRHRFRNNASAIDLAGKAPGHVDIPRLEAGRVGGFFWSVYTDCPKNTGVNFTLPTNSVRDTLEQIDVAKALINKYPNTFSYATSAADIRKAFSQGKVASLLGVEGGHQLGNSLAALRQYHTLGVRYVTLTHSCNNIFADSAGIFVTPPPIHGGLSPLGRTLISELNRLGVLVDLSHTADSTTLDGLKYSEAPVIWSHSSARSVWNVPRNVPDEILELIGEGEGKKDAVVQVNFAPYFVAAEGKANVAAVADHVEHIGKIAGRRHVGLGSDFDGIGSAPEGLEDVSTYPHLFAELIQRGWTETELAGLASENFLRVFEGAERVARRLQREGREVAWDLYEHRDDL